MDERDAIAAAAADWVVRRDRGFSARERAEFESWIGADPRHAREVARIGEAWRAVAALRADERTRSLAEAVARRRCVPWYHRGWFDAALVGTAAAVLAVFVGIHHRKALRRSGSSGSSVVVVSPQAHVVTLSDGSRVEVRTDGQIHPEYTPAARIVRLVAGEAHFSVSKNPAWPFRVEAGAVAVRAVGTAFDVRETGSAVEVLVTEGKVRLEGAAAAGVPVAAGQRATIALAGPGASSVEVEAVTSAQIEEELAWRTTRLEFNETPLAEVVDAFNRFGGRRLVLGDPSLGRRTLTGTFDASNVGGFVRLVRVSLAVESKQRDDGVTVLLRSN